MESSRSEYSCSQRYILPRCLVNRQDYILEKCQGKRVLHVGFAGRYKSEIANNNWLHYKIFTIASELYGVDNDLESVKDLRDNQKVDNIYLGDAYRLEDLNLGKFDVILAGEILEHLVCPGRFLESSSKILKPEGHLLITTINAFNARRMLGIIIGKESVHIDHVAYYSHYTLKRLCETFGYRIEEQMAYRLLNKRPYLSYFVELLFCFISPNTAEGIICLLKKND